MPKPKRKLYLKLCDMKHWITLSIYFALIGALSTGSCTKDKTLHFSVAENLKAATLVGQIYPDRKDTSYVIATNYKLICDYFDESEISNKGRIVTKRILDHEEQKSFIFQVYEVNNGDATTILIDVLDMNDNSPIFTKTTSQLLISEAAPVGHKIKLLAATDADSFPNDVRRYMITSESFGSGVFRLESFLIDGTVGSELILQSPLDRENISSYEITVTAYDGGSPPLSASISYKLLVEDVNDNPPIFINGSALDVSIPTSLTIGDDVITACAEDRDLGRNGEVIYAVTPNNSCFDVDPKTGRIFLVGELDFEDHYEFWLRAEDQGAIKLSSSILIRISVINVSQNDPVIDVMFLKSSRAKISESVKVGEDVARITIAYPEPKSESEVRSLNISLTQFNSQFGIRSSNGLIYFLYVRKKLDREIKDVYHLSITATDHQKPPRSTTKFFKLRIDDVNDNPPKFDNKNYHIQLDISSFPGAFVHQLKASDADLGKNSRIRYKLLSTPFRKYFTVNEDSGLITTTNLLKKTKNMKMFLVAEVEDFGKPKLSSQSNVTIHLSTDHDTSESLGTVPRFMSSQYEVVIEENISIGTCILQVSVYTESEDLSSVSFHLISDEGQIFKGPFEVNSISGRVCVSASLDFERKSFYQITVKAEDQKNKYLFAKAALVITIKDVPDDPPIFKSNLYSINVSRDLKAGSPVTAVRADDKDTDDVISYEILSATSLPDCFVINLRSGTIYTKSNLSLVPESQVNLTVVARDKSDLQSNTLVVININDQVPEKNLIFSQNGYKFSVDEDAKPGLLIGRIKAFYHGNKQVVTGNEVKYSIEDVNPIGDWLKIKSSEIFLDQKVDREIISEIKIKILASVTSQQLFALTNVLVTINDINDNEPQFHGSARFDKSSNWLLAPIKAFDFTSPIGEVLRRVHATDGDASANGSVTYSLSSNFYSINPKNGEVTLKKKLPEVERDYSLIIKASDNGNPALSALAVLEIRAKDRDTRCPRFKVRKTSINIVENVPVNSWINNFTADVVDDSTIFYRLKPHSDSKYFEIKHKTSSLYLKQSLDRETKEHLQIVIVAEGDPSDKMLYSSKCKDQMIIEVEVIDFNDNSPEFIQSFYRFHIKENATKGDFIGQITAVDKDKDQRSDLVYSFSSPINGFSIEHDTGKIYLSSEVHENFYKTTALVCDREGLNRSVGVHIIVDDVNNHKPKFINSSPVEKRVFVITNLTSSFVADMQATDIDKGCNARLNYSILNSTNIFSIDPVYGIVQTKRKLTFWDVGFYDLVISVSDAGTPQLQNQKVLKVKVTNLSNPSYFDEQNFVFATTENVLRAGSILGSIKQNSSKTSSFTKYYLHSGNDDGDFYFNETSGEILIARKLDYERKSSYQLIIKKRSDEIVNETSPINIWIYVEDVNESTPTFKNAQNRINIFENTPIGAQIHQITADDEDIGRSGNIQYSIYQQSPESSFTIDIDIGTLKVVKQLNRENISHYLLIIKATNNGSILSQQTTSLQVNLLDVNDNPPVILSPSQYYINENHFIGTDIFCVLTDDIDEGLNAVVTYTMDTTLNDIFSIDYKSGVVTLNKELDYEESKKHCFNVTAQNGNIYHSLSTKKMFCVNVLDVNDVEPMFEQEVYQVKLPENTSVGSYFIKLKAFDLEEGANGNLVYSIKNTTGSSYFEINSENGLMRLKKTLDYEDISSFVFQVIAKDSGIPALIGRCLLKVEVLDINDNSPQIISTLQSTDSLNPDSVIDYIMLEEVIHPAKTVVYTVIALDEDSGLNGKIRFTIEDGNTNDDFEIDENSGVVRTKKVLDRERTSFYWLKICASDLGHPNSRSSLGILKIRVLDWNDFHPLFMESEYFGSVPENLSRGQYITTVRATDKDFGENARVTYTLTSEDILSESLFEIDYSTGVITTTEKLNREMKSVHQLTVIANDSSLQQTLSSKVDVTITVLDINDNYPTFENNYLVYNLNSRERLQYVKVKASDDDEGANGQVNYRLLNYKLSFGLERTGRIIQYKILPDGVYRLRVVAFDGGSPSKEAAAIVEVHIGSNTSQSKYLATNLYVIESSEVLQTDHQLLSFNLRPDVHFSDLNFNFVAGNEEDTFEISPEGKIIVVRPLDLDFEKRQHWQLVASINSSVDLNDEDLAVIKIKLSDENDNAPKFSQSYYYMRIYEQMEVPSLVLQVRAFDLDSGRRGDVRYSIVSGFPQIPFEIDEISGKIFTKLPLDREVHGEYSLIIRASDQGDFQRVSSSNVRITVLDKNDHTPSLVLPSSPFLLSESASVGSVVFQAAANDVDLFPLVSFQVEEKDLFTIHRSNGKLILKRSLDYEKQQQLNLTIKVNDGVHEVIKKILIEVSDSNDNQPAFDKSPANYFFDIDELSVSESNNIIQVQASDEDSEEKGSISYNMVSVEPSSSRFSMSKKTGIITLNPSSAFSSNVSSYVLQIEAVDNYPPNHSAFAVVEVKINDNWYTNRPLFNDAKYSTQLSESSMIGTSVLNISASLSDNGYKGCGFRIFEGDEDNIFLIQNAISNQCKCEIILRKKLDFEDKSFYNLKLVTYSLNDFYKPESYTDVEIEVINENDSEIKFNQTNYAVNITKSAATEFPVLSQFLLSVHAVDVDYLNSEINYSIVAGNSDETFFLTNCDLDNSNCISINARSLHYETTTFYSLTIAAIKSNLVSGISNVSITIVSVNVEYKDEKLPYFAVSHLELSVLEVDTANSTIFTAVTDHKTPSFDFTYSVEQKNPSKKDQMCDQDEHLFHINSLTGKVYALKNLNYERCTTYSLLILLRNEVGQQIDNISLDINILSVDEFPPIFRKQQASKIQFVIPYGSKKDYIVGQIFADDLDSGIYGQVEFTLDIEKSPGFGIDAESGLLYLKEDFYSSSDQVIRVIACSSQFQNSSTEVMIRVAGLPEALGKSQVLGLVIGLMSLFALAALAFITLLLNHRRKKSLSQSKHSTQNGTSIPRDLAEEICDNLNLKNGVSKDARTPRRVYKTTSQSESLNSSTTQKRRTENGVKKTKKNNEPKKNCNTKKTAERFQTKQSALDENLKKKKSSSSEVIKPVAKKPTSLGRHRRRAPYRSDKKSNDIKMNQLNPGREIENGEIVHKKSSSSNRSPKLPQDTTDSVELVDSNFCQIKMVSSNLPAAYADQKFIFKTLTKSQSPPRRTDDVMMTPKPRNYLSSSSKCPFTSPTPSFVSSISSSTHDHHQWTPEFTPMSDVIDEISRLREDFSRQVSSRKSLTSPGVEQPPLLTSSLQSKALVANPVATRSPQQRHSSNQRTLPPSYDVTMRRIHTRKRSIVSTNTTSSSSTPSPQTILPKSNNPVTSLRLTITRPEMKVQTASKSTADSEKTVNERMLLV